MTRLPLILAFVFQPLWAAVSPCAPMEQAAMAEMAAVAHPNCCCGPVEEHPASCRCEMDAPDGPRTPAAPRDEAPRPAAPNLVPPPIASLVAIVDVPTCPLPRFSEEAIHFASHNETQAFLGVWLS